MTNRVTWLLVTLLTVCLVGSFLYFSKSLQEEQSVNNNASKTEEKFEPAKWKEEYNSFLKEPINVKVWHNFILVSDLGHKAVVKINTEDDTYELLGKGKDKDSLEYPYGLEVIDGILYVSDCSIGKIKTYDVASNKFVRDFYISGDRTKPGFLIAVNNHLLFSDLHFKRIVELNEKGEKINSWGEGILHHPQGLALMNDNSIAVADEATGIIYQVSKDLNSYSKLFSANSGSGLIRGISVSSFEIIVTLPIEGCIRIFDFAGNLYDTKYLKNYEGVLGMPFGLDILADGSILIADRANGSLYDVDR